MSETGSVGDADSKEKMKEAKKLANEAAKALEIAKEAEAKASAMRGGDATKFASDRGSEIRTRKLLGGLGGVFYKSWTSVLRGRPGKEGDPLGLQDGSSEQEQLEKARAVFESIDEDGSGGIDLRELTVGLREVLGYDADEQQARTMLEEADENGDGFIDLGEFVKVVDTFRSQIQAEAMVEEDRLKEAARAAAKVPVTREKVVAALEETQVVGSAEEAVKALDGLKQSGTLRKWNSYQPTFRPVGADKMKAVTGMEDAETDLGLNVDLLTRARYQGIGFLGVTGAICLFISPFFPLAIRSKLDVFGFSTLAFNVISGIFAGPIDLFLQKLQLQRTDPTGDRWVRRQAARLVAAYMCGIPLERVEPNSSGNIEVDAYSRRDGNPDIAELRKSITPEGFLALGLTERQVHQQSIIQMTALVAEYKEYGRATFGYRFFRDLDRQLDLCQRLIDRREKQIIARFGVTSGHNLLESHQDAVERVVVGLKKGSAVAELIAEIEAADVR